MSTPANAAPANTKTDTGRRKWARYKSPSQLLRLLVFLLCLAGLIHQSTKSVLQFIENPITITVSEKKATHKDYPYILACHPALFLDDQSDKNYHLSSLFYPIGEPEDNFMRNYSWGSTPLQNFETSQFAHITFEVVENKQLAGEIIEDSSPDKRPIFTNYCGPCMIYYPWSNVTESRFLSIFGNERVEKLEIKFLHKPDNVFKINRDIQEHQSSFHMIEMEKHPHLQLQMKKTVRLSANGFSCNKNADYVQEQCYDKCLANYILKGLTVKCGLPWLQPAFDVPNCKNFDDYFNLLKALSKDKTKDMEKSCDKECPEACTKMQCQVMEVASETTDQRSYALISMNPTINLVNEFQAYKFMNMIGDIGGMVGILLGFSVFGIFDDVSQYIRDRYQRNKIRGQ